mmetsp:Transcript_5680/g.14152  ORF Transcript_5680/g.14152 Transcript_5680/m.14152 type:complete len:249 (+) Transcript_5680:734-1480(+)
MHGQAGSPRAGWRGRGRACSSSCCPLRGPRARSRRARSTPHPTTTRHGWRWKQRARQGQGQGRAAAATGAAAQAGAAAAVPAATQQGGRTGTRRARWQSAQGRERVAPASQSQTLTRTRRGCRICTWRLKARRLCGRPSQGPLCPLPASIRTCQRQQQLLLMMTARTRSLWRCCSKRVVNPLMQWLAAAGRRVERRQGRVGGTAITAVTAAAVTAAAAATQDRGRWQLREGQVGGTKQASCGYYSPWA